MPTRATEYLKEIWINLAGSPLRQLRAGEILHAQHIKAAFVMAVDDGGDPDRLNDALSVSMDALPDQGTPAFCVVFTPDDLAALENGRLEYIWVPVADNTATVLGEMRFMAADEDHLKTELGTEAVETIVLNELRRGDVFAIHERNKWGDFRLSRALADDDPATGLRFEYLCPRPADYSEHRLTLSGNHLVFRVKDPAEVLRLVNMQDIR